tara:strand:+ start:5116 stop:5829 length:714 start_codon:yes stop_codon:yes gene_type:complete
MKKKYQSIAIIPARKGSKGIKNKSIKNFCKKPLIAWSIETALESSIDRVVVNTNCEKIRKIAIHYGAEAPYLRNDSLAQDNSSIESVLVDQLNFLYKTEKYTPDILALILPTSPFRNKYDINNAIKMYKSKSLTSVVSVTKATANLNPEWMLKNDNGKVKLYSGKSVSEIKTRRQDLSEAYIRNDFIYLLNIKNLYQKKPQLYGSKIGLLIKELNRPDVDINTKLDWEIAEKIFQRI